MLNKKNKTYYICVFFFCLFVLFLYGPTFTIVLLSFQGPDGGLTFPLNGVSIYWFQELWRGGSVVDIGSAFKRSIILGLIVMVLTVLLSVSAGLAFRKKFWGSDMLFFATVASLIVPSIVLSLGVALQFRLLDDLTKWIGSTFDINYINEFFQTSLGMFTSGLGAQLTWTLPFGLLIMFAVFNRFDKSYEEAARDLGATPWKTFKEVVFPLIAPSIIGIALFGFNNTLFFRFDLNYLCSDLVVFSFIYNKKVWHIISCFASERISVRYLDTFRSPLDHIWIVITESHKGVFPA